MGIDMIVRLMRGGILRVVMLASPALVSALIVGLIVAIFQATTSIQEQTLTFLPKILVMLAVLALLGGWMFQTLSLYTIELFSMIPQLAK